MQSSRHIPDYSLFAIHVGAHQQLRIDTSSNAATPALPAGALTDALLHTPRTPMTPMTPMCSAAESAAAAAQSEAQRKEQEWLDYLQRQRDRQVGFCCPYWMH